MPDVELYQYMFDSMPGGICRVALDEELTILYANRFFYEIYGYTAEDAKEKGFTNAKHILLESEYPAIHAEVVSHVDSGDRYFQLEYRGIHSSGKLLWLLVRCAYDPDRPGSILCVLVNIAKRKLMEEELRLSVEESKIAFQLTDKLMYIFDIAERRLYQPESVKDEFGLPAVVDRVPYSIVESGAIAKESEEDYINFYEAMVRGEPHGYVAVRKRKKDGTFGWYEAKFSVVYDSSGSPRRGIISCDNITEQREREVAYQKWSQYFKSLEGKTIGYYEYNLTKDTKEENAGDTPPDYLKPLKKYTETMHYVAEHFVCEEDRERFCRFFDRENLLARFYEGKKEDSIEYLRKGSDNSPFWVRATTKMIADPYTDEVKLFMMTLNIDQEKSAELKLRSRVEHDGLTGLYNREAFVEKMTDIIEKKEHAVHALVILDIDRFKEQNDNYGHQFGDQVIKETAGFITGFMRKDDLCGRLGGDEFMAFFNNINLEDNIIPRIEALCRLLQREYEDKGRVSCSLGVAFYPRDGMDFQELYRHADVALYEVKKAGRANYMVYRKEMEDTYELQAIRKDGPLCQ